MVWFFHSSRIPRTNEMVRKNSIHKTLFQVVPTWDIPTTKIFWNRVVHFGEHQSPQVSEKTRHKSVSPTESGLHFKVQKVCFLVIGSIGSGFGAVFGKLPPPFVHERHSNCEIFQCFTPSAGMQARFVNKFQPKRKQSKSQQKFWTKSAVFARVCYDCGPLWVAKASRTLG